jgi:hypothetical protein
MIQANQLTKRYGTKLAVDAFGAPVGHDPSQVASPSRSWLAAVWAVGCWCFG